MEGCSVVAGVEVAETKLKMIQNKFRRIEKLLKDSFPMDSGREDRWKEKEKIRGRLGSKKIQQQFPGNGARKLIGYFSVTNKSAITRIPL